MHVLQSVHCRLRPLLSSSSSWSLHSATPNGCHMFERSVCAICTNILQTHESIRNCTKLLGCSLHDKMHSSVVGFVSNVMALCSVYGRIKAEPTCQRTEKTFVYAGVKFLLCRKTRLPCRAKCSYTKSRPFRFRAKSHKSICKLLSNVRKPISRTRDKTDTLKKPTHSMEFCICAGFSCWYLSSVDTGHGMGQR